MGFSLIAFIGRHPFISAVIIIIFFFGGRYLYSKGYFKRIGLDKKSINKSFKDLGFSPTGEEEDFSATYNIGDNSFFEMSEPEITKKKKSKEKKIKEEPQEDFFAVDMNNITNMKGGKI